MFTKCAQRANELNNNVEEKTNKEKKKKKKCKLWRIFFITATGSSSLIESTATWPAMPNAASFRASTSAASPQTKAASSRSPERVADSLSVRPNPEDTRGHPSLPFFNCSVGSDDHFTGAKSTYCSLTASSSDQLLWLLKPLSGQWTTPQTYSLGHHAIDHLDEKGVEIRDSARRFSLKGRESVVVTMQTEQYWKCFSLGSIPRTLLWDRVWRTRAFSIAYLPCSTDLKWTERTGVKCISLMRWPLSWSQALIDCRCFPPGEYVQPIPSSAHAVLFVCLFVVVVVVGAEE